MHTPWRRACTACTKAKRQCTKQTPACRRCIQRGADCHYPPPRRPAPLLLPQSLSSSALVADATDTGELLAASLLDEDISFSCNLPDLDSTIPNLVSDDLGRGQQTLVDITPARKPESSVLPWFLHPSSWKRERLLEQHEEMLASSQQLYVDTIRNWLFDWVSGSSPAPVLSSSSSTSTDSPATNPLIHPELYRREMPRIIQDAYTAITTYQYRTPANTETALRILEARTDQLIQEQAVREAMGDPPRGTLEHLARVHALLAYQVLGLFDGNVRARARADGLVDTLFAWCDAMWTSAKADQENKIKKGRCCGCRHDFASSSSSSSSSSPPGLCCHRHDHPDQDQDQEAHGNLDDDYDDNSLWHTFIHVESVRRALLTAQIVQNIYLMQKTGWSSCAGGVVLTMRRGVWSARSAYAWKKRLALAAPPPSLATTAATMNTRDPLLGLLTTRLDDALEGAGPGDVDDFGLALLGVHFGEERLERWMDEKGAMDSSLSDPSRWL
ncbi:hypothetical protein PFICI_01359 [Pestalotiopsis fici W106-1]|uniref:Zn(2)-C6 fungal-type domain-containing protein n=1 Tax=Pestalotiopsis fici (strain W106-1 / CGMCC3.15140) TaxID=1229662 RepID=W3XQI7_PESFW|nr:uncharacterized protein PFICI_01359 [Pestalotiopsis fici W106-1]ETS87531.1 hypothetical protein PFICI_01359 [Pestalotiopsis fici W106-1]